MAPSASAVPSVSSKIKRLPPGIQTNGITSSTSSPSPSMSAGRLPSGAKNPPNSATCNGGGNSAGPRSASRARRETPGQLLGRGQRNSSAGLRSASIAGDMVVPPVTQTQPYIKTDAYILKKYRGHRPSLIVHLYATHFRFDQQEGSFSYKSPMKILLEHLRKRTVPHELIEFLAHCEVPFYEGCMIVQVHDHKTIAPSQDSTRSSTGIGKTVPFSIHNYNPCITPSPYVPYPVEPPTVPKHLANKRKDDDTKTAAQKDKENMPAPEFPADSQRKASSQKKPSTIVLHPTSLSNYLEIASKCANPKSNPDGRLDSRQDSIAGCPSAIEPHPPTPAIPATPQNSMAPPAKRLKKMKMELDSSNVHLVEAQIALATNAPLVLDPVSSAAESAALLKSLSHPMHTDKPPSPKTRKRTVAEMAADEALAAEQERFMLLMDERLSVMTGGAQGGAKPADSDGQAGGASFEPRFERFKALENIKLEHEELKRTEKARAAEAERKKGEAMEKEKLRLEAERSKEQEKQRAQQLHLQQMRQEQARQQEVQRRQMMAAQQQLQQGMQGVSPQVQGQHSHPQPNNMPNGMMANGMQGQPQRFHQQHVTQAQMSSPIIRNGTPHSNSSPTVGSMGNVPMQHSTSSMGGSPPRPGSVVHQNHPQMPNSHAMTAQRSQQSQAETPRIPSATPNVHSTPLSRQVSATPRMSAASPQQPQMAQTPHMGMGHQVMMNHPQLQQMTPAQQHQLQQQMLQRRLAAQAQHQAMNGMMNGQQQMSPQQFANHQQQMRAMQAGNQAPQGNQIAANYAAQMAAMQRSVGGMGQQMNPNMMANNAQMANMQQLQQMQQFQFQQQQQQQMQQAQHHQVPQMNPQQAMQQRWQQQIIRIAQGLVQQALPTLQNQYPGGIPPDILDQVKRQCHERATAQIQAGIKAQRQQQAQAQLQQQQQQMLLQHQQGGMPQNMNGMGMQR